MIPPFSKISLGDVVRFGDGMKEEGRGIPSWDCSRLDTRTRQCRLGTGWREWGQELLLLIEQITNESFLETLEKKLYNLGYR